MRRWIGGTVAALGVLACAWWIWTASLERELDRRILALRRAGLPIDRRAFVEAPVPPEEDAAPLLKEFSEWFDAHERDCAPIWFPEEVRTEEDWQQLRTWVEESKPAVETLRRAVARPACSHVYDPNLSPPLWVISTVVTAQDVRELVEVRVEVAVHDGEGLDDALATVELLWAMARHLDDRFLIGVGVRSAMEAEACRFVRTLSPGAGTVRDRARAIVADWRRGPPGRTLEDVLAWERAAMLETLRTSSLAQWSEMEMWSDLEVPSWLLVSLPFRPLLDKHVLRQLDSFAEGIALVRRVDPRRLGPLIETAGGGWQRSWYEPFAPEGASWVARLAHRRFRRDAWLSITATGLDVLAWRDAHGAWPDSLAGFPDAVDPFTGEPLVYERVEGGARVAARDPDPDEDEPLEWVLTD